jgi:hypothetical protein
LASFTCNLATIAVGISEWISSILIPSIVDRIFLI